MAMGRLEPKKIKIGDKEYEYFLKDKVSGLAWAFKPYFRNKKLTVVVADRGFYNFLVQKAEDLKREDENLIKSNEDLLKPIIAHEYGHRELFRFPPHTMVACTLFLISLVLVLLTCLLTQIQILFLGDFTSYILLLLALMVYLFLILYNRKIEEFYCDKYAKELLLNEYPINKAKDLVIRSIEASEEFYERNPEYRKSKIPNSIKRLLRSHPHPEVRIRNIRKDC